MKRNRDAIAQMAIYDLLCRMQKAQKPYEYQCVLELLDRGVQSHYTGRCDKYSYFDENQDEIVECPKCIAEWLNERSE